MSALPARQRLAVTHVGTDRQGRRFASDGNLLVLESWVESTHCTPPALLTTETVERLFETESERRSALTDLVRSKIHPQAHRTPDDVALGDPYVRILLAFGRALELYTSGRTAPVLLRDGAEWVGVLMPLDLPPELDAAPQTPQAVRELGPACPSCGQSLSVGEGFCTACGQGIRWNDDARLLAVYPELSPGQVLTSQSFETAPFPGRTSLVESLGGQRLAWPVPGGKLISYTQPITSSYVAYDRVHRDACVRASFTLLDPGARIGLAARHAMIGKVQIYYLFEFMPLVGRAWCSRGVSGPGHATSSRIGAEVRVPPVALNRPVELELRVAGPTLHAYIDGERVLSGHDAAFGAGAFGIRVGMEPDLPPPVRVICHGYEVREVAP